MAVHGGELLDIASHNGCDLLFEASVAWNSNYPSIKTVFGRNYISEAMGIVNGTTNFILTKMTHEGMEFDEALALATELGYAEADPTADIEGYDADVRWRSWHPLHLTLESHLMMYTQKESQISQQKISNMQKQWDVRSNC